MKHIIIALFYLWIGLAAASEEEVLRWQSFKVGLGSQGELGTIEVSGELGRSGYKKLEVKCFNKTYEIPAEVRVKLGLFFPQTLNATHEAGYEITGGHTLHLKFTRSIADGKGGIRHEKAILSIPKNAKISINIEEIKM